MKPILIIQSICLDFTICKKWCKNNFVYATSLELHYFTVGVVTLGKYEVASKWVLFTNFYIISQSKVTWVLETDEHEVFLLNESIYT